MLLIAAGVWLRWRQSQTPIRETATAPATVSPTVARTLIDQPPSPHLPSAPGVKPLRVRTPTHVAKRNVSLPHNELTAAQREEAVAAKQQLMLALRVVSTKLNLARRTIPANNNIRYQHKNG